MEHLLTNKKNFQNAMFDRIKILFFDVAPTRIKIYHLNRESIKLIRDFSFEGEQAQQSNSDIHIIGFEMDSGTVNVSKLIEVIKENYSETKAIYYFTVKSKNDMMKILRIIKELSLGEIEIYGLDPDYYYSIVPLYRTNSKLIEKYILNLKTNFSIKGRVKQSIKSALIDLGSSTRLYEKFIITVQ